MTVFNNRAKQKPFTMIDNGVINNPQLSMKSKAILIYLLSKPEGWQVYESDIQNHCTDGRDSIRSGLAELIKAGYIVRGKRRVNGKFGGYEYEVFDEPTQNTVTENPTRHRDGISGDGKTGDGKTGDGKPADSNIDLSNIDLSKKEVSNERICAVEPALLDPMFETWWKTYPGTRKRDKAKAKDKWLKVIKTIPPGELLLYTQMYAADKKAIGHDGRFAKMPITFLNARTYLDYEGATEVGSGQRHNQTDEHSGSSSGFNEFVTE